MTTGRMSKVKKVQNIEKSIRMLKIEKIRKNYKIQSELKKSERWKERQK